MSNELQINFRLPPPYTRKLRALADANNTSPSLAARHVLIESLENTLREELVGQVEALQEEIATLKASQRELLSELKAFRSEFDAALRRASRK